MVLEKGTYWGGLTDAYPSESQEKKTPCLCLVWEITHKRVNDQWEAVTDKPKRTISLWLSDAAWEYTVDKLAALGFNGNFENPKLREDIYSKGFGLVCAHQVYDGKTQEKWDLDLPYGGGAKAVLPKDQIAVLNARWKRIATTAKAPTPAMATAPTANDDVPF